MAGEIKKKVIEVVNMIPHGKVTYYGRVAQVVSILSGRTVTAQLVGRTLSGMKEESRHLLPWQRVVNKAGIISTMKLGDKGERQKKLLKEEGIEIIENTIDMNKYGYLFEDVL